MKLVLYQYYDIVYTIYEMPYSIQSAPMESNTNLLILNMIDSELPGNELFPVIIAISDPLLINPKCRSYIVFRNVAISSTWLQNEVPTNLVLLQKIINRNVNQNGTMLTNMFSSSNCIFSTKSTNKFLNPKQRFFLFVTRSNQVKRSGERDELIR